MAHRPLQALMNHLMRAGFLELRLTYEGGMNAFRYNSPPHRWTLHARSMLVTSTSLGVYPAMRVTVTFVDTLIGEACCGRIAISSGR